MADRNTWIRVALCAALPAAPSTAQALSSSNHFVAAIEWASGGPCGSLSFRQHLVLGSGIVPTPAASPSYRLVGGFAAMLDVAPTGVPWITSVTPGAVTPNGGGVLYVRGIGLDLGTAPTLRIGTRTATILSRVAGEVRVTLPPSTAPGRPSVTWTTTAGSAALIRAFAVLPVLGTDPAPAPQLAFDLVFQGSPGDTVLWAAGASPAAPVGLPPLLHGLELDPSTMLVLPGLAITNGDGVLRFPVPPTPYVGPIYLQAVFTTSNPGYAPGSFSNAIKL